MIKKRGTLFVAHARADESVRPYAM